ncbi:SRPBCC family protein [Nocardioides currus]|uniref:Polyketide cyclase n=1 Tax=Nocardioides currus TaxID=2133958 RepID=A0A2R7Z1I1_9ACTN|nr:SRPBCC family protein [Nocardioides currus]PUA82424.1 polyketide cyclase [Nocardioides currus]
MLRIEATGSRPADDVWDLYTSPAAWPTWAPQIRSVRCDAEPIEPGARGVVHGPLLVRLPFTIESVDDRTRAWSWRVGVGPASVVLDHGVREDASGTCAWAVVHLPALLVLPYQPIARWALSRLVEGGSPPAGRLDR